MERMITLISKTDLVTPDTLLSTRVAEPSDSEALARLLFTAYENNLYPTQSDAQKALDAVFAGEIGDFFPEASPVVVDDNGRVVAAVLCLKNRKDGNEPVDVPTIYELVTAASRRRQGIAEKLIRQAMSSMKESGFDEVTVRIPETNAPALALYLILDYRRWQPAAEDLY